MIAEKLFPRKRLATKKSNYRADVSNEFGRSAEANWKLLFIRWRLSRFSQTQLPLKAAELDKTSELPPLQKLSREFWPWLINWLLLVRDLAKPVILFRSKVSSREFSKGTWRLDRLLSRWGDCCWTFNGDEEGRRWRGGCYWELKSFRSLSATFNEGKNWLSGPLE